MHDPFDGAMLLPKCLKIIMHGQSRVSTVNNDGQVQSLSDQKLSLKGLKLKI
jgi:hypothetical protein